MTFKKITAVLFAEEIEPCAKFWTERFGFARVVEVPEGNKVGFVVLQKDGVELMYQSYTSADKDNPRISGEVRKGPTFLYAEVDDLKATMSEARGAEVVMPERETFYGARETSIKDPAGHVITFAQFKTPPAK
jgi:uncharacterized glyoxalase superfamily protein PhnB